MKQAQEETEESRPNLNTAEESVEDNQESYRPSFRTRIAHALLPLGVGLSLTYLDLKFTHWWLQQATLHHPGDLAPFMIAWAAYISNGVTAIENTTIFKSVIKNLFGETLSDTMQGHLATVIVMGLNAGFVLAESFTTYSYLQSKYPNTTEPLLLGATVLLSIGDNIAFRTAHSFFKNPNMEDFMTNMKEAIAEWGGFALFETATILILLPMIVQGKLANIGRIIESLPNHVGTIAFGVTILALMGTIIKHPDEVAHIIKKAPRNIQHIISQLARFINALKEDAGTTISEAHLAQPGDVQGAQPAQETQQENLKYMQFNIGLSNKSFTIQVEKDYFDRLAQLLGDERDAKIAIIQALRESKILKPKRRKPIIPANITSEIIDQLIKNLENA